MNNLEPRNSRLGEAEGRGLQSGNEDGRGYRALIAGMVAGVVLMAAGMALCTIGVPIAMRYAFADLGKDGIGDPKELAARISHIVILTYWGTAVGAAGLGLFVTFLVLKTRAQAGKY